MVDLTLPDDAPAPDAGEAAERLVARVQAWQHRHPLARRLPAADVGGLGVIALPFDTADAGGKPRPLFHQPSLVPGLSHRALVEFAHRHAVTYRPGPADWPLREVERADASTEPAPETRYLLTAAITEPVKPGAQPRRLLIAPEAAAIWGPRPLSRTRVIAAAVVLLLILASVFWGLRGRWSPGRAAPPPVVTMPASAPAPLIAASAPRPAPAASAPAVAPSRPAAGPVAASAAVVPAASVPARAGSTLATVASAVAPAASAPKTVPAPVRGPATPEVPAASGPPAASPPASVALPPPPKLLPMPALRGAPASAVASVPSAPAPAASAVIPTGPHFALVSMPSKKRAGAEETLARIRKLLGPAIGNLQAQVMPTPEGFVVTLWPLPTQADAEQMASVLSRRGVPMKWLEF